MKKLGTRGFTLVEMLITISLLAIVTAIAVPSMQRVIRAARVDAEATGLLGAIQNARSEAIKRGRTVSLAAPSGWTNGLTIFVDSNEDLIVDSGEAVLFQQSTPKFAIVANSTGGLKDGIVFSGTGAVLANPISAASNQTKGHLALKVEGEFWATICLGSTGRSRIYKPLTPSTVDPECKE